MTETKAQLNGLRIAPRKVELAGLIKGKSVDAAVDQLRFYVRRGSPALIKLVESAVANAENNNKLERASLFIKNITVDEGAKLKRYRPERLRSGCAHRKEDQPSDVAPGFQRVAQTGQENERQGGRDRRGAVEEKKSDKKTDKKTE